MVPTWPAEERALIGVHLAIGHLRSCRQSSPRAGRALLPRYLSLVPGRRPHPPSTVYTAPPLHFRDPAHPASDLVGMAAQTHATHTSPSLPLHGTSGYSTGQLTPVTSVESTQRVVENSQPPPMPESSLPCLPLQAAQLRGPKPSSYRPAVLRPTERPYRPSPLTPPQSSSNSLDSMPGTESPRPRSKQSAAGGLGRSVTAGAARDEHVRPYSPYSFAKVTAPPTREHWKVSDALRVFSLASVYTYFEPARIILTARHRFEFSTCPHDPESMLYPQNKTTFHYVIRLTFARVPIAWV